MKQIIINGDDYGYSQGVNAGIVEAYKNGILTSTTVLANTQYSDELFPANLECRLAKPQIGIGVHLNLTSGIPIVEEAWEFEAFSRPLKGFGSPEEWQGSTWEKYFSSFSKEAILREFRAQVRKVIETFGEVDHLDSHHGVASYKPVTEVYEELAKEFVLPVRHTGSFSEKSVYGGDFLVRDEYAQEARKKEIKTVDRVNMQYFHSAEDPIDKFHRELEKVQEGEVVEFMFHPAVDDNQGAWRMKDLQILTSEKVIKAIGDLGLQLTTYRDSAR